MTTLVPIARALAVPVTALALVGVWSPTAVLAREPPPLIVGDDVEGGDLPARSRVEGVDVRG